MAEPEKKKLIDTPEFKAAVDDAVEAAMGKLASQLTEARKAAGTTAVPDDQNFMRQLAMAIAEVADQGTHRKRVAPEILAARTAARERMGRLILDARANGLKPAYRLTGEVYLNERRLMPFTTDPATKKPVPQEITWTGAPNECMHPLDEAAEGIFAAFMESIGGATNAVRGTESGPLWVTQNGLTVRGHAPGQRRAVGNLGDAIPDLGGTSEEPSPFADDLKAYGANDPRATFVHVTGTVAPPARQNPLGETPATARQA